MAAICLPMISCSEDPASPPWEGQVLATFTNSVSLTAFAHSGGGSFRDSITRVGADGFDSGVEAAAGAGEEMSRSECALRVVLHSDQAVSDVHRVGEVHFTLRGTVEGEGRSRAFFTVAHHDLWEVFGDGERFQMEAEAVVQDPELAGQVVRVDLNLYQKEGPDYGARVASASGDGSQPLLLRGRLQPGMYEAAVVLFAGIELEAAGELETAGRFRLEFSAD